MKKTINRERTGFLRAPRTEMRSLGSGDVHVWLCPVGQVDVDLLIEYRRLLTREERARETRFRFPTDRHRYVITRAAVRTVLSRYVGIEAGDLRFRNTEFGRPELLYCDDVRISFNISHTDDLVLIGVNAGPIGVDVESLERRKAPLEVAENFFAPTEVRALHALPKALQHEAFFRLWTLKESYIKARGKGLSIPLDQFAFDLSRRGQIDVRFTAEVQDSTARWQFSLLHPTSAHVASICAARSADSDGDLVARRVIPLVLDEPCAIGVVCKSP